MKADDGMNQREITVVPPMLSASVSVAVIVNLGSCENYAVHSPVVRKNVTGDQIS